jgi:penicillin-binding protein 2
MIEPVPPSTERRLPASPQLALRVAIMGGVALLLFAIVFFRLWYLQVLSGDKYVQQAETNRVRDLPIPAPRGQILDRNGQPVASDVLTNAVMITPTKLPADSHRRAALLRNLGRLIGMTPHQIRVQIKHQQALYPYADVTVKTDAGPAALTVLSEQQTRYPGVHQQQVYLRTYPDHQFAAQVLGYVGQVSQPQLRLRRFRGVHQGTVVGQSGVEYQYDRYLRGTPGVQRIQVTACTGVPGCHTAPATSLPQTDPLPGHDLKLTIDTGLQKAGESALQTGIGLAQANGNPASRGAFVALDPRNGEVLAMGSTPTFDPNVFAKPLTQAQVNQLFGRSNAGQALLFNRAISGGYPTGSTFKPITALAALQSGLITPDEGLGAGSCIPIGSGGQTFCNAGKANYGAVGLVDALKVSSDTYFATVGEMANGVHGEIIQTMARRLGLGHTTGIDLPGEAPGNVPDAAWRAHEAQLEAQCERKTHRVSCGISDKRLWSVGDNVNLSVGQGDLLASPLQMAVVYSTLENGGRVVRPHLGLEVDDTNGSLIQRIDPAPARHVNINESDRQLVLEGLHEAASQPGGTSADVWAGWNQGLHPIFGKTGTAQHVNQADQSWYVCFSPDPARPIVIAVTIEQGGFGAQAAAPAARQMMSQWFYGRPGQVVAGHSLTL